MVVSWGPQDIRATDGPKPLERVIRLCGCGPTDDLELSGPAGKPHGVPLTTGRVAVQLPHLYS